MNITHKLYLNSSNLVPINENNENKNKYRYNFPTNLIVYNNKSKISISQISIYNSFLKNISIKDTAGLKIYYNISTTTHSLSLILPDGYWSINDIINWYYQQLEKNGVYLIDPYGNKIFFHNIYFSKTRHRIIFKSNVIPFVLPIGWSEPYNWVGYPNIPIAGGIECVGKLGDILSMPSNTPLPFQTSSLSGTYESESSPHATLVTSFIMQLNIISNKNVFINPNNIIFTGVVDENRFGELIPYKANDLVEINVTKGIYPYIEITFLDNLFNPLQIIDDNIFIELILNLYN